MIGHVALLTQVDIANFAPIYSVTAVPNPGFVVLACCTLRIEPNILVAYDVLYGHQRWPVHSIIPIAVLALPVASNKLLQKLPPEVKMGVPPLLGFPGGPLLVEDVAIYNSRIQ